MSTFSGAIKTAAQLHQAVNATYLTDVIIGVVFIIAIIVVANIIKWQPGAYDPSPRKRRLWFWVFAAASLLVCLGTNYWMWMRHIEKAQLASSYTTHLVLAAVAGTAIYAIVTFVLCKVQKKETKLASIFS